MVPDSTSQRSGSVYDADVADDVSSPTIRDPFRISPHAVVACFAAAVSLALLATWTAGSIAPRIAPMLLLTTCFTFCTMILGAIMAQLHRKQRPLGANLALALAIAVLLITLVTILPAPNHPLMRAIFQFASPLTRIDFK
jgi:drug/metabolite transporter (DMT)-like permease